MKKFINDPNIAYNESPFLANRNIDTYTKINKIADAPNLIGIYDKNTNDSKEDIKIVYAKETELESLPFIKVYDISMSFLLLSQIARTIIVFIVKNGRIKYNSNQIIFSVKDFAEKIGHKNTTNIYKGVNELINYGFWAKHEIENVYWLNHNIMFLGERRRLIYNKDYYLNKQLGDKLQKEENPNGFGITQES